MTALAQEQAPVAAASPADTTTAISGTPPKPSPTPQNSPPTPQSSPARSPTAPMSDAPPASLPSPSSAAGNKAAQSSFGTKKAALQLVKGMKPVHVVEAALFAAGKPVSVEEIQNETGLPSEAIRKAVKELAAEYEKRDTVLEVGKAGTKWAMQVRRQAAEPAARFAPMEIAPKLLKTLALIAYHQPMKQSELVEMVGSKTYDHVPELVERGLIRSREEGVTKILTTTAAFPEYFGLDAASQADIRAAMAKLVGLPPPPPRGKENPLTLEQAESGAPGRDAASVGTDEAANPAATETRAPEETRGDDATDARGGRPSDSEAAPTEPAPSEP